jgi:hypothetical protein
MDEPRPAIGEAIKRDMEESRLAREELERSGHAREVFTPRGARPRRPAFERPVELMEAVEQMNEAGGVLMINNNGGLIAVMVAPEFYVPPPPGARGEPVSRQERRKRERQKMTRRERRERQAAKRRGRR